MNTTATYIPMDRRQALVQGRELPERTHGAALFADISGFTPLTEMLARTLGARRGAEELTIYLNKVYDALITELYRYGGSVIGFSGDAITCWFDEHDHSGIVSSRQKEVQHSALRATAAALAMQQAMAQFKQLAIVDGGTVTLAMKAAIATGPVRRFVVGDPAYMLLDVMAGVTLDHLAAAEHRANKGEVILSAATAGILGELVQVTEWRTGEEATERFAVVTGLNTEVFDSPWSAYPPDVLSEEEMRSWLQPPVYRRLHIGQGEFLAELRPAAALFLRFGGIDYDTDPDAGQKLNTFIQQVEQILDRYDGSLLQVTIGDKGSYLYAAFGAPVAHEDDVDRAASAALELQALPDRLSFLEPLQIGITYGRMRAGAYGGAMRRTYGVLGDAVNLSARLMQAARPGQILVSQDAATRASDSFIWEELPPIQVKGKSEPVALNQLTGRKTQLAIRSLDSLYPHPIVGRQDILARLDESLAKLLAGKGQVIRLEGEAGMGKSHLAAQFSRRALLQGCRLAMGVCQGITSNDPYRPWQQIFSTLLDLEGLAEAEAVARLTTFMEVEHPKWALRLPLLGDLLALPIPDNPTTAALDSDIRQKTLFSLLVEMVTAWASEQPLILLVENAQWMDEASLELTQVLAQQAAGVAPVMLLILHRPEYLGDAPLLSALGGLPNYTGLLLDKMGDEEVAALVQRQLGGPPAPVLLSIVQTMTRGNPFFISELIDAMQQEMQLARDEDRSWRVSDTLLGILQRANFVTQIEGQWQLRQDVDLSTVKLGVPDSIHELILSRLDRLPEPHKVTLKVSSVVGQIIDLLLVTQAHPEAKDVAEIQAEAEYMEMQEVVHEEKPEQKLYSFRQPTTQEVAYETLLYAQRQQLHRAVAYALVDQQPDAIPQIAHHAFLGQAWALSLQYNLQAGERAKQLHANQQSIDFFQKALTSAGHLPETDTAEQRKGIHMALGELFVSTGQYDAAGEHLEAALALARSQGDKEAEARSCRWYGRSYELRGEYGQALTWLERGFEALNGQTSTEEAELSLIAGLINIRQGNYDKALELCRRSLQVGDILNDAAVRARTYNLMGIVDRRRGSSVAAIERFEQSLMQYEELNNVYGQATSHNLIANGYFMRGEWSRSDYHYRQSLDMFTQIGSIYSQVLVNNNLGGIAHKQGRLEAALGYYQRALRLLEQIGGSLFVFGALHMNMGGVYLRSQQLDAAAEELQLALSSFNQAHVRDLLPELYGLLAELAVRRGDVAEAETYGRRSLELAREMAMPLEEGRNLRILGEIAQASGEFEQAQQYYQEGHAILSQAGDQYESARAQLSLAGLHLIQGEVQQALMALNDCEEIFGRLEAQLDLDRTRQLLNKFKGTIGE